MVKSDFSFFDEKNDENLNDKHELTAIFPFFLFLGHVCSRDQGFALIFKFPNSRERKSVVGALTNK